MKKTILALQLPCTIGNMDENFKRLKDVAQKNLKGTTNVDFLILPELWSIGWKPEIFSEYANDDTVSLLQKLAREYEVNIIGGSYVREVTHRSVRLYNSCPVIDRTGELLGHYDKNHLFTPDGEAEVLTAGDKPTMFEIEDLRIGFSICYDIRFPELYRSYMKNRQQPHFFVNVASWPKARAHHFEILAKARAVENQSWFLGLSQCGNDRAGGSILVEPFGETVVKLDSKEGKILATIDTDAALETRQNNPSLKTFMEKYIK
jgi:predicted amidohydrolase